MAEAKFAVGDVVNLKSGGGPMVVLKPVTRTVWLNEQGEEVEWPDTTRRHQKGRVLTGGYELVWLDAHGHLQREMLLEEVLEKSTVA